MATELGTLERIARAIGRALAPLAVRMAPAGVLDYFAELGMLFPPELVDPGPVKTALDALASTAGALSGKITALEDASANGNGAAVISAGIALVGQIGLVLTKLDDVAQALEQAASSLPGVPPNDVIAFAHALAGRVREDSMVRDLEEQHPLTTRIGALFDIVERPPTTTGDEGFQPPPIQRALHLERLSPLLRSPAQYMAQQLHWGEAGADPAPLLAHLDRFLRLLGFASRFSAAGPDAPVVRASVLKIQPASSGGLRFSLSFDIPDALAFTVPLRPGLSIETETHGHLEPGAVLTVTPPSHIEFTPASGVAFNGGVSADLVATPVTPKTALALFGVAGATRLEAASVHGKLGFSLAWDGSKAVGEPFIEASVEGGRAVLDLSAADAFLGALSSSKSYHASFQLAVSWSASDGLRFRGSGGMEVAIPLHAEAGPVTISTLYLASSLRPDAGLALEVSAALAGHLGPVTAAVDRVGIQSLVTFPAAPKLGVLDATLAFKAPSGIGIAIDAGPVTGGGFLFFDEPNGRYGGALVLKIYSVTVKAFGVIETRLPEGGKTFSFVIVISAEFTPIQLGLGFTLNGVGGMIGINRRIEEEGLRRAVRDGSLGHLLFPHNLEQNAPQIIHDLVAVLPAAEGRYVFGPMAKIGWGSPTLIEADLGIILELPGPRLALLGEVRAALPKRDKALVLINLSVAGLLDFPRKFFAIDASLHDSRVGSYPITGDMAMRLSWGDDPTFALAVGGFNPGFQPPPSFPKLRRVAVDLGISGNPSLTLQGYFALTSNTAQIGALAELKASGSGIQLYARVQFDALIVFSPFAFEVAIDAQARVSFHGRGIGVHLHGIVNGPSPWRVRGEVCVSILWWDACLGFDKTFGKGERVELAQIDPWLGTKVPGTNKTDVLGLQEALQDTRNWTPELPPGAQQVVSVSEPPAGEDGRPVDPLGAATARERVCPLRKQLDRFGQVKPAGPGRFDLESAQINGKTIDVTKDISYVKEPFAPAQYFNMSDSEKLSAPSFQKLDGGLTVKGNARNIAPGSIEPKNIEYQTKVLGGPQPTKNHFFTDVRLEGMRKRSGTGLFGLRRLGAEAYLDPTAARKFTLDDELFVIANINDLTTRTDLTATPITKIEALFKLRDHRAANPSAGPLAVVPKFEVGAR